jgi:cytochrome c oxidase cbb3-type subunit I/II
MPAYPWLFARTIDVAALPSKLAVQRTLGVPYPNWTPEQITTRVETQAKEIAQRLKADGGYVASEKEIVAVIAYLQHLGKSEKVPAHAARDHVAAQQ